MPRIVGENQAAINYRHIIDSLVRKPGAFANYQYREEMSPTPAKKFDIASQLTDQLKELRLPTIRDQFQDSAARATTEDLSHLAYLSELLFTTCSLLVQQLPIAKRDLRLPKLLKQLSSFEGLIIGDPGYVQQRRERLSSFVWVSSVHTSGGTLRTGKRAVFSTPHQNNSAIGLPPSTTKRGRP